MRKTGDANSGFDAARPDFPKHITKITYVPDLSFESPVAADNAENRNMVGRYPRTRGGLLGIDYGGAGIDNAQGRW